jgi:hypothetical protein
MKNLNTLTSVAEHNASTGIESKILSDLFPRERRVWDPAFVAATVLILSATVVVIGFLGTLLSSVPKS